MKGRFKELFSKKDGLTSSFPGIWTRDGRYLMNAVADILIRSLADVNKKRPKDPIGELATSLYTLQFIPQDVPPTKENNLGSERSTLARNAVFDHGPPQFQNEEVINRNRTQDGENILHFAASIPHKKETLFQLMCHSSSAALADRDKDYKTPRDRAIETNMTDNVSEIDTWIATIVVLGKIDDIRRLFLGGYMDILDLAGKNGMSVIDLAKMSKQKKTVDFLKSAKEFQEKRDFLHKAIQVGSEPHVEYLAESEDLVVAKDTKGRTSLHIATLSEEKNIMKFLASRFPNLLGIGDNLGRTPLHYAMALEGVDQVAKILVQAGARRTLKDLRGKLPSYYFINRGEILDMIADMKYEKTPNQDNYQD